MVIVGSLCVWVAMVSVRGAAPATHSLGGRALFCLGFVVEVSGLRACCVNIAAPTRLLVGDGWGRRGSELEQEKDDASMKICGYL